MDYGARWYHPGIGRFLGVDPLVDQRSWVSPYNYVQNSPLSRIDPTGALDNPIYDEDGNFLGTDDRGLQGDAIVMAAGNFTQGMSHKDALSNSLGSGGLVGNAAVTNLTNHFNGLRGRPDFDGFVTITEGVEWARNNPGALNNPTPDNMLYIDVSQLDFGNLSTADFQNVNTTTPINLFTVNNFLNSPLNTDLRATVYALGRVDMRLTNRTLGQVQIVNDFNLAAGRATDYDWNGGGGRIRGGFIGFEQWRTGLNDASGFRTYYYGTGVVNLPPQNGIAPPPVN